MKTYIKQILVLAIVGALVIGCDKTKEVKVSESTAIKSEKVAKHISPNKKKKSEEIKISYQTPKDTLRTYIAAVARNDKKVMQSCIAYESNKKIQKALDIYFEYVASIIKLDHHTMSTTTFSVRSFINSRVVCSRESLLKSMTKYFDNKAILINSGYLTPRFLKIRGKWKLTLPSSIVNKSACADDIYTYCKNQLEPETSAIRCFIRCISFENGSITTLIDIREYCNIGNFVRKLSYSYKKATWEDPNPRGGLEPTINIRPVLHPLK